MLDILTEDWTLFYMLCMKTVDFVQKEVQEVKAEPNKDIWAAWWKLSMNENNNRCLIVTEEPSRGRWASCRSQPLTYSTEMRPEEMSRNRTILVRIFRTNWVPCRKLVFKVALLDIMYYKLNQGSSMFLLSNN